MNKIRKFLVKALLGKDFEMRLSSGLGENVTPEEKVKRIYDFFKSYGYTILSEADAPTPIKSKDPDKDPEETITPKGVIDELGRVPCPIECEPKEIDARVALMERKIRLGIDNTYTKAEMEGMVACLKRRARYNENKEFFEKFDYTTTEKIEGLLEKHPSLCMKGSTLFVPTFPEDAISAMEAYKKKCKSLFDLDPVFYVIAKKDDFRKKEKKNDPILLVQSPFGFFWQILGAWDEEMLLLEEL